jgi:hypothetical protein
VVDGASGKTLGFEVLFEGDGGRISAVVEPYAKAVRAEVLLSGDNDSYGIAAELSLGASAVRCTCAQEGRHR